VRLFRSADRHLGDDGEREQKRKKPKNPGICRLKGRDKSKFVEKGVCGPSFEEKKEARKELLTGPQGGEGLPNIR